MLIETLRHFCRVYSPMKKEADIELFLQSSPAYPSLLAVIQTLQFSGIKAIAGKCEMGYLQKLPSPFLLHLRLAGKEHTAMARWNAVSSDFSVYFPKEGRWRRKTVEDLEKVWSGVVIYTNQPPVKRSGIRSMLVMIAVMVMVVLSTWVMVAWGGCMAGVAWGLNLMGWLLSVYLLAKEYGYRGSPVWDKLCHLSAHADCRGVSASKYGTIAGFKMSELSVAFFTAQLCIGLPLFYFMGHNMLSRIMEPAALVSIPLSCYSVYSQLKIKRFCPYCILILMLLVVQMVLWGVGGMAVDMFLSPLLCLGTAFVTLFMAMVVESFHTYYHLRAEVHARRHHELMGQKRKPYVLTHESTPWKRSEKAIRLGRAVERNVVTTLISPSCPRCKQLVKEIFAVIDSGIIPFRWEIVMGETHEGDDRVNREWIRCYLHDPQHFFRHLRRWCRREINYCLSSEVRGAQIEGKIKLISEDFARTIKRNHVEGLPRMVVNRRMLSSLYSGSDVVYLLADGVIDEAM